jgi:hypothetical protein
MNDRPNPNNLHNTQDSVEARLARAAQQLDTAAANYAYRTKTEIDTSAIDSRSDLRANRPARVTTPRRRFAPFAAIGGAVAFAGSLIFGASVISNQAEKPPVVNIPIEVASPSTIPAPTSDFPFVGELRVSLPSPSLKDQAEELNFVNGVAISSVDQRRLTLGSAIDIDVDGDGAKELAVLINHDASSANPAPTISDQKASKATDLSKKSSGKILGKEVAKEVTKEVTKELTKSDPKALDPSLPVDSATSTSAIAIVRVTDGAAKTLAATPSFDSQVDALLMNRKTLWSLRFADTTTASSGEAILQRALINIEAGTIDWAPAESPIARTELPLIVEGDKQIRFSTGTTSAIVFAARGTRRGWFTAKAGQTLTIGTIGMPSNKSRQITLLLRKGSNDQSAVGSGVLPGPLTTVLPHGGDYEILVGEGTAETTFELIIK